MKRSANIHIDKIRVTGLCSHSPIGEAWYRADPETGEVIPVAANPEEHALRKGKGAVHMHSKGIGPDGMASQLLIECCPPLVLQRHNLFGHSDLGSYVYAVFDRSTQKAGIDVRPEDRKAWRKGHVKITEIHLTANFSCPSQYVEAVIDAIDENNRSGKHRDSDTQISLGYTEKRRSKNYVLSIYYKYLELLHQFGPNPGPTRQKLLSEAINAIRAELKLFSQYLKNKNLNCVSAWSDIDVASLYFELLNKFKICSAIQQKLTKDEMEQLTMREANVYRLWLEGVDIRNQFKSRTSINDYAQQIKAKTGIDIRSNRRPEALPEIDLGELFTPSNVLAVPKWLKDSQYFCLPAAVGK